MDSKALFSKLLFNKRMNSIHKNNYFIQEQTPSLDKQTFRENKDLSSHIENKENSSDLANKTIKLKEKTISNTSNLFAKNTSLEKFEKSTPGFNKYQRKFGKTLTFFIFISLFQ